MKHQVTKARRREEKEKGIKEKEHTNGAKEVDPRVGATIVEETTMPESAHRVKRQERAKGNSAEIHSNDNGRDGTLDLGLDNGKISGQATPRDGEKENPKG